MSVNYNLNLQNLSDNELSILKYLHENSEHVSHISIQKLASEINYSTSTILRLCKKMGLHGFPELKYYLSSIHENKDIKKEDSVQIDYERLKSNIINDIEGSAAFINTENLPLIANLLLQDVPLYLHSPSGVTDICVRYLERLLFISGRAKVYTMPSLRTTRHTIQSVEPGNIFIFISHSGNYEPTLDLVREARLKGMKVISFSSLESNQLADLSTYSLRYFAKNRENNGADISNRLCCFFVISQLIQYYNMIKMEANDESI
ncbi:MAG: MurR/RpiR family transcriptional regulator [Holdemanella sp.]|nr:MurR/RpiR family transcriptional regulator [Holdemanella sp.]